MGYTSSGLIHRFDTRAGESLRVGSDLVRGPCAGFSPYLQARASTEEIREGSLSLIASYDGEAEEVGFTITVFSTVSSLSWDETSTKLPFSHKASTTLSPPFDAVIDSGDIGGSCSTLPLVNQVDGMFTSKNAGGNYANPSYMRNPQYHLRIDPEEKGPAVGRGTKARVLLVAQTNRNAPLNISVVWSDGSRVFE